MAGKAKKAFSEKRKRPAGQSRRRGHGFEREIAGDLKPIFPNVRRLLENHKDDANGVDLLHTGKYRVQCKRSERIGRPIVRIMDDIQCDREWGEVPLLVVRIDEHEALVTLPWSDFLGMLATLHRGNGGVK